MTSLFDAWVYARRNNTPFTEVHKISFLKTMAQLESYLPKDKQEALKERGAILRIVPRPDVASRFWYTIEWTGPEGQRHHQSSQEIDLVFWRAVQAQIQLEAKEEGKDGPDQRVPIELPIPMVLHCPDCKTQHVDEDEWKTKVHRTHLCANCKKEWQPSLCPTVGVWVLPKEEDR
jgi:hypothetical protein